MNDAKKLMELTPAEIQRIVETLLLIPDICNILKIHKKNVNFQSLNLIVFWELGSVITITSVLYKRAKI